MFAFVSATLTVAGCMTWQAAPIPTARIEGVSPCVGCHSPDAVIVTVSGDDAIPNATMVLHDLRVMLDLGQQPAVVVRADERGHWTATLRALRVPNRVELPVLPGDLLEVFQRDGDGDASPPYRLAVPTPELPRHETPPIVPPEEPQASEATPDPSGS